MAQLGFIINNVRVPIDDALAMASRGDIPYPPALLAALCNSRDSRAPTASVLTGCLRQFELKRNFGYYATPENGLAALFGTAVHKVLEHSAGDGQQERLLTATLEFPEFDEPHNRVTLLGTADHIDESAGIVRDWKTKKYLPVKFEPPFAHAMQVNIYHWLHCQQDGAKPLQRYELVYLDQSRTATYSGELRPLADVEHWIRARLYSWLSAVSAGELPDPVPQFYNEKPQPPCSWCEVRYLCRKHAERGG